MEKPLQTPKIWQKTLIIFYLYWEKASKQHPSYHKALHYHLKHPLPKAFFVLPTTPDEIKNNKSLKK